MNRELERLIMSAGDLPTIPVVATKVMQLIEDENATSEEMARVVSSDPAVAARVIKISNSSFYGCQRQIQTLSHAIMMLGFNTLRSLVIAASVKQVYKPYGLTEKMLWEHSFGAGLAARIIARSTRAVNEEEAFLAGLFHDIGKIVMNTMDNHKFQTAIQLCYNDDMTFKEAERMVFSYSHCEVGALVVKKWNFPDSLVSAVARHHDFEFEPDTDPYQVRLACVTGLANLFCHHAGVGTREPEPVEIADSRPAKLLQLDPASIESLLASFSEAYDQDKGVFG